MRRWNLPRIGQTQSGICRWGAAEIDKIPSPLTTVFSVRGMFLFLLCIFWIVFSCQPVDTDRFPPVSKTPGGTSPAPPTSGKQYQFWLDLTWKDLLAKRDALRASGFELVDVETYVEEGQRLFAGVWHLSKISHRLWKANSWDGFLDKWREFRKEGIEIVDLEVYQDSEGILNYLATFRKASQHHRFLADLSWDEFLRTRRNYTPENYWVVDVEAFVNPMGELRYAAIWVPGTGPQRIWKASSLDEFIQKRKEFDGENLLLVDVEIFLENGIKKYLGVWLGTGREHLWLEDEWSGFRAKDRQFREEGAALIDLEIDFVEGSKVYTGVWQIDLSGGGKLPPEDRFLETGALIPLPGGKTLLSRR